MLRNLFPDLSTIVAQAQERHKVGEQERVAVAAGPESAEGRGKEPEASEVERGDNAAGPDKAFLPQQEGLQSANLKPEHEDVPSTSISYVDQADSLSYSRVPKPTGALSSARETKLQAGTGHGGKGPLDELPDRLGSCQADVLLRRVRSRFKATFV